MMVFQSMSSLNPTNHFYSTHWLKTDKPVGLDSEKSIFSEKRGKEAKRWGKEAKLMSLGHIREDFKGYIE